MIRYILSGFLVFGLAACATVMDDTSQDIAFEVLGAEESYCIVDNGMLRYRVFPPETRRITKKPGDLVVECFADGGRSQKAVYGQKTADAHKFNALTGGAGGLVDYHTGALFQYPERIVMDFRSTPPQMAPLPSYQHTLQANPEFNQKERIQSGMPALPGEYGREPHVPQRRHGGESLSADLSPVGTVIEPGVAAPPAQSVPTSRPSGGDADSLTREMNPGVFSRPPRAQSSAPAAPQNFVPPSAPPSSYNSGYSPAAPIPLYMEP